MFTLPRHAIAGVAVLLCASVIFGASPALPALAQHSSASPSQVTVANNLINRLVHANGKAAQMQALIDIMSALNLGVYKENGEAIVRGGERGPHDFYLYNFEVSGLWAAFEKRRIWTIDDVANELTDVGFHLVQKSPDPEIIYRVMTSGASWAAGHTTNPASISFLLIRALGQAHNPAYDVLKNPPMSEIKLDALQFFLVAAEILLSFTQEKHQAELPQELAFVPISDGDATDLALNPCDYSGDASKTAKWFVPWGNLLGKTAAGKISGVVTIAIMYADMMHAMMVGTMIDTSVVGDDSQHRTHWGPGQSGHSGSDGLLPGKQMIFRVRVLFDADYPPEVIKCGALLGYKIPSYGPMADVPVDWSGDVKLNPRLSEQGTVVSQDSKTRQDGTATMIFKPNDEEFPNFGRLDKKTGLVRARIYIWSGLGNVTALVTQLGVQRRFFIPWVVERHKPKGFRFDATFQGTYTSRWGSGSRSVELVGEVCGEDPYAKPWTITDKENDALPGPGNRSGDYVSQIDLSSRLGGFWRGPEGPVTAGNQELRDYANLQFMVPPPPASPQMKVDFNFIQATGPVQSPQPQKQTVDVTDATDCSD